MVQKILRKIRKSIRAQDREIDPDEIFLDSHNLPDFDVHQMEGRIETPINRKALWLFAGLIFLLATLFVGRLGYLQIVTGAEKADIAENNWLRQRVVFAERGLIYDRNGKELVSNTVAGTSSDFSLRKYTDLKGLSHVLGYVSYPAKDSAGYYLKDRDKMNGVDGVEGFYNDQLLGRNGNQIIETNALGEIKSQNTIDPPVHGNNLTLSIDGELTSQLYTYIGELSHKVGFTGGAGVIMDVQTGEVIALTSYPEFSSQVMTDGVDRATIAGYNKNSSKPFLDKVISGLYTPGSIVKPFMGVAVLQENIISPFKEILSTGAISIKNRYGGPDTVFRDWKAHGYVDLRKAIAVSSDVYFYVVGGGYEDQVGLGIDKIASYMNLFGFGIPMEEGFFKDKAGVVPTKAWKAENFNGEDWLVGNTYHTAIGQYGFQVTPIQAVRAVASLANNGTLVEPTILASTTGTLRKVPVDQKNIKVAQEGMRQGVTSGITAALNVPYVNVAAKSGTAELGSAKQYVNSWITGFFPYEHPRYAFAVVMERGPHDNLTGAVFVMRNLLDWMHEHKPQYLQ